jgi:hypothetical protein
MLVHAIIPCFEYTERGMQFVLIEDQFLSAPTK